MFFKRRLSQQTRRSDLENPTSLLRKANDSLKPRTNRFFTDKMMLLLTISFCIVGIGSVQCVPTKPEAIPPTGRIHGSILDSRLGRKIYSFRGVRYAEAPTGERRFKVNCLFVRVSILHSIDVRGDQLRDLSCLVSFIVTLKNVNEASIQQIVTTSTLERYHWSLTVRIKKFPCTSFYADIYETSVRISTAIFS